MFHRHLTCGRIATRPTAAVDTIVTPKTGQVRRVEMRPTAAKRLITGLALHLALSGGVLLARPAPVHAQLRFCRKANGKVRLRPVCKGSETEYDLSQIPELDGLDGDAGPTGPQGPA